MEAARPEVVFSEDGRLSGSGGVNRIFGPYQYERDILAAGLLASTMMAGPPDAMDQETLLLRILSAPLTVARHGDGELLLTSLDHILRLARLD